MRELMSEPLADRIIKSIGQAAALYHRMVIVAAAAGSGKTGALQEVQVRIAAPLINVNIEFFRRLLISPVAHGYDQVLTRIGGE